MGYVDEIAALQQQMKNYMERLNTGRLSSKDNGLIVQVAGNYYESLEEYKKQEHTAVDDKFNDILNEILNFQDGIIQKDAQAIRTAYEKFSNTAEIMTLEKQKLELMMQTFKTDIEEMNLHEMKLRLMQDFVNIDLKLYGSVTEKTLEVLDVQKCKLVNKQVQEKMVQEIGSKEQDADINTQEKYKTGSRNTGELFKLKLPQMEPEQKRTTEKMFFQKGARYDKYIIPAERSKTHEEIKGKSWYVKATDGMDLSPFIPYIREAIIHDQKTGAVEAANKMADAVEWNKKVFTGDAKGHRALVSALAEKLNDKKMICRFIEKLHGELAIGNDGVSLALAAHDVLNDFPEAVEKLDQMLASTVKKEIIKPARTGAVEQSYQGSAYLKGTGERQEPVILYGSSPEDIVATLQGWNRERTEKMQLKTCYIRKLNTETNKYDNVAKYEVDSGIDITPIYLNVPHMDKDKFIKVAAELRNNGAKYNPVKKAFYITKQNDLNLFSNYLPIAGTQSEVRENEISNENQLSYEIESGQEYYDNRVLVTVEGMAPFNIYGDKFDVHFPSLSAKETREIIEKFVLPELEINKPEKIFPKEIKYNGQKYNPLQYNVLELAINQNFTQEQMALLERPELTSDRMNEIRFAVRDGLSAEQIQFFATPAHEQWQMDLCRTGMQHGMTYEELKPVISSTGYTPKLYGERRNQLNQMIKGREKDLNAFQRPDRAPESVQNQKDNKTSVLFKLEQYKAKLESGQTKCEHAMQHKEKMETER